ncbi:hypothetical protein EV193_1011007 [Herbihabitans rhizosphaerae]|uniref:Uncharacterized protein n=1 Tax=Herbihabitans rhizosphaerae TaxID=1872711 RepID=A0A4Q7L870_9PSEU|nr:hypothetical protein EV193_1011007 [Herbihabitans rhizosphaerae]
MAKKRKGKKAQKAGAAPKPHVKCRTCGGSGRISSEAPWSGSGVVIQKCPECSSATVNLVHRMYPITPPPRA